MSAGFFCLFHKARVESFEHDLATAEEPELAIGFTAEPVQIDVAIPAFAVNVRAAEVRASIAPNHPDRDLPLGVRDIPRDQSDGIAEVAHSHMNVLIRTVFRRGLAPPAGTVDASDVDYHAGANLPEWPGWWLDYSHNYSRGRPEPHLNQRFSMATAFLVEIPGVTEEEYEKVTRKVNEAGSPAGCIFHGGGPFEGGIRLVGVGLAGGGEGVLFVAAASGGDHSRRRCRGPGAAGRDDVAGARHRRRHRLAPTRLMHRCGGAFGRRHKSSAHPCIDSRGHRRDPRPVPLQIRAEDIAAAVSSFGRGETVRLHALASWSK